ncbi:MAG: tetratricopeptide repeat protein [Spirochaetaceae bacterium]|jgi:tetratricopeptide (TPR) repeat protein|nr:tetratricopeptide repeat protein [Spirochaetaceae bacterium]
MKNPRIREYVLGFLVIILIGAIVVGFQLYKKQSARSQLASRIAELSPRGGPPETIEGLREAIALYEDMIEEQVNTAVKTGIYWKILSARLQDKELYGEAFKALERAVSYTPEDPALHYSTGLVAGLLARDYHDYTAATDGSQERARYYSLAEEAYRRAIAIDERYTKAHYGLAVLYVFELNRPAEAIPHLERYLEIQTRDTDAMFILARAFYATGGYDRAVELYDEIISITKDSSRRRQAEDNKQQALSASYGS